MSQCAFCNRAIFEERIIAEDDLFFVIATLGQITDGGYVLIFPKRHTKCMSTLTTEEMIQFFVLLLNLEEVLGQEYDSPGALFEHGIVGQTIPHAHMHLVPTTVDLVTKVTHDFPDTPHRSFEIIIESIPTTPSSELSPYLLWRSNPHTETHMWLNPPAPPQYFRTILAEKLNRPERADWKKMDPDLDQRLWAKTVTRLKPYFS